MPSFTSVISDLESIGPLVECRLAVNPELAKTLTDAGEAVPPPIPATMLVDTGASATAIEQGLAQQLGLNPVGVTKVTTPSDVAFECAMYSVMVLLPKGLRAPRITVFEANFSTQGIQGLIGRDILKHGVLVYLGLENQFTLSF